MLLKSFFCKTNNYKSTDELIRKAKKNKKHLSLKGCYDRFIYRARRTPLNIFKHSVYNGYEEKPKRKDQDQKYVVRLRTREPLQPWSENYYRCTDCSCCNRIDKQTGMTRCTEAEAFLRWGAVAAPNPAKHWSKLMAAPAPAQKPKPSPLPNATPGNYPPAVRYASSHPYPTGIEPLFVCPEKRSPPRIKAALKPCMSRLRADKGN